jgi:hypothetical protein
MENNTDMCEDCNYISEGRLPVDKWFALLPVKTVNSGWIWLKIVDRICDDRPEKYLGLLPTYTYYYLKQIK